MFADHLLRLPHQGRNDISARRFTLKCSRTLDQCLVLRGQAEFDPFFAAFGARQPPSSARFVRYLATHLTPPESGPVRGLCRTEYPRRMPFSLLRGSVRTSAFKMSALTNEADGGLFGEGCPAVCQG